MSIKKTCIIITGPTAVGKTSIGIRVAQHFSSQIISADSRQCFKELDIGVAKPSPGQLLLVPHHFISSHSIREEVNAAVFEKYALQKAAEIFRDHNIAVMVGGTGLYIKTFCEGIDEVPVTRGGIREQIVSDYTLNGLEWLQQEVEKKDPLYFATGEIKNPHRLMRALEVKISSGRSILDFQGKEKANRDFDITKIGLELPRQELYDRINERVQEMMEHGLLEEVKNLVACKHLNALQTVGYKELFDYLDDKLTLSEAIEQIRQHTRNYAKRQMTWFKKDTQIKWCGPDAEAVLALIGLLDKTG